MNERVYQRRIEELEDIVHKQRLKISGLNRKLEKIQKQSAAFVKHTIHVFQMCNVDWRDMVKLYDYCIAQDEIERKLNDKDTENIC